MADKKDYYIYVAGEKVLVSKEIYDAITQMDRQERTQSDKDKRNKLLRYEELTTDSVFGEELIYDFMQDIVWKELTTSMRFLHSYSFRIISMKYIIKCKV